MSDQSTADVLADRLTYVHEAAVVPSPMSRMGRRRAPIVIVVFVALTAWMALENVRSLATTISAFPDSYFSIWRLGWIAHQLPLDPKALFHTNIFHPETNTAAFSDIMLLPGLLTAPAFWLGARPALVFNVLLLAGFVTSALGAYLLVRSLTGSTIAGIVAGIGFAFAPFRFDHYTHLETQVTAWAPLAAWALHRALRTGSAKVATLVGVFVAGQLLSALYYGIYLGPYLGVLALVLAPSVPVARRRPVVVGLVLGGAIALLLLLPYVPAYLDLRSKGGIRSGDEMALYSARLADYLSAPVFSVPYGWTADIGGNERHLLPGLVLVALAVVGLWPPVSRVVLAHVLALLFALEASRGPHGVIWRWLELLAPYQSVRVPARFALLVLLSLTVLAGFGVARLLARGTRGRVVVAVAVALMLFEYRYTPPLDTVPKRVPNVYAWLARQPRTVMLGLPIARPNRLDITPDPKHMYFSVFHWQPMVNGYSGFYPESYWEMTHFMLDFPSDRAVDYLVQRGVQMLVVDEVLYEPKELEAVRSWLVASPRLTFVGEFSDRERPALVFRIR